MLIRIVLADPHLMFREAVRALLERRGDCEVVAEVADGNEALRVVLEHEPDLVISEATLPRLTGIEVARRARKQGSGARFLFLTANDGPRVVEDVFQSGATGFVCKRDSANELMAAVDAAIRGQTYVSPKATGELVRIAVGSDGSPGRVELTSREREVLQLVAEGHSSKEISELLRVSVRTVDSHRANVMEKLGIHKVSGLVRYAIREGLLVP